MERSSLCTAMYYMSLTRPWRRTISRHAKLTARDQQGLALRAERRRERSERAEEALTLWLRSTAQRMRLPCLVLADNAGLLVASSLDTERSEELAALAPLLLRRDAQGRTPVERHKVPMAIHAVDHEGATLLLIAVSGEVQCRERGLAAARLGVRRILRELVQV
jgi:hypothetical protein